MSAPDTSLRTQKKRHWGPLAGIAAALVFAAVLTAMFAIWVAYNGNTPGESETQAGTGAGAVQTEVNDPAAGENVPKVATGAEKTP